MCLWSYSSSVGADRLRGGKGKKGMKSVPTAHRHVQIRQATICAYFGKRAFACAVLCNVSSLGKSGFQVPSERQISGHHVGEEGGGDLDQRALRPRALQAVQGGALPPLLSCSSLGLLPVWGLWGGVLLSKMFAGCCACS